MKSEISSKKAQAVNKPVEHNPLQIVKHESQSSQRYTSEEGQREESPHFNSIQEPKKSENALVPNKESEEEYYSEYEESEKSKEVVTGAQALNDTQQRNGTLVNPMGLLSGNSD